MCEQIIEIRVLNTYANESDVDYDVEVNGVQLRLATYGEHKSIEGFLFAE